ncbi:hypothetical protein ACH4SP_05800 [Streptomyces sp. NPDC021093]|uniref:hypothetical protein n=1 Tax=Streptomyces sp. NPDC021093 TaxID=3365112 RepID=UPI00378EB184
MIAEESLRPRPPEALRPQSLTLTFLGGTWTLLGLSLPETWQLRELALRYEEFLHPPDDWPAEQAEVPVRTGAPAQA